LPRREILGNLKVDFLLPCGYEAEQRSH